MATQTEEYITGEELAKLEEINGEMRGVSIKEMMGFILLKEGKEGLFKLENALVDLGYGVKYADIKMFTYYRLVVEAIIYTLIKKIFNYTDEQFIEMGYYETKSSPTAIRLFLMYLISIEDAVRSLNKMWRAYYTVGHLKVIELNKEVKYAILRIEDYKTVPYHCLDLRGYFSGIVEIMVKAKVTCIESKCVYKGDEYHEFILRW